MKVKVEKITTNLNTFRTPLAEIDGLLAEPEIGQKLFLTSSTHESGGIITSLIEDVQKTDSGFIVETANSVYVVDYVDKKG